MKANEFVKKFGLELAQRDIAALESGFIKREDFLEHYGFDILDELKRIVESHTMIQSFGSLEDAKEYESMFGSGLFAQAIADVESCL